MSTWCLLIGFTYGNEHVVKPEPRENQAAILLSDAHCRAEAHISLFLCISGFGHKAIRFANLLCKTKDPPSLAVWLGEWPPRFPLFVGHKTKTKTNKIAYPTIKQRFLGSGKM